MIDETSRTHAPEAAQPPLPVAEEAESAPPQQSESIPDPAHVALEIEEDTTIAIVEVAAQIQEVAAITVAEIEAATESDPASPSSQPLASALSISQETEQSNKISDLSQIELKALEEFKILVQETLDKGELTSEEASIWGVPLLQDDRSDVILLKFLRARDFKLYESFIMLKNTMKWRQKLNVDENFEDDLEKVVFMHGHDKEGHPVCYNVYGEFQDKELYRRTFADEGKRQKFMRWRIHFLEKSIRQLDFSPGGSNNIFQISDLKNSPGPWKKELRSAFKLAFNIFQDNYPEFVAKQLFINVPWWYLAFYIMISPLLTQRTKSKFIFAGPSETTDTLFKYISPEQVPTQFGGLSANLSEGNAVFTVDDPATEIDVTPATKQLVEIIVKERGILFWEIRVVGWEVSFSADYVPNDVDADTVIIHQTKKMLPEDEPVVSNSFNASELGQIRFIIDNPTKKTKKLLYRFRVLPPAN